jgi:pimeloyl-ACP methyl ester carboxylesterase
MKIQLDNITFHYEQSGTGRPILFFHGQGLDHRYLHHELEPLFEQRPDWRRIYVDLPGHGQSEGPDWITHQDQVLEVVLDFIDQIVPRKQIALVGSSYGCYFTRGIAYHRPAQVDGMAMIAPMILADRSSRTLPPHVTLAEDRELVSTLSSEMKDTFEHFVVVQNQIALQRIENFLNPAREVCNDAFQERLEANRAFSFDVDRLDQPFEKPVLLVMGRQDSVVGYQDQWRILDNYPRATFAVLDKTGHLVGIAEQLQLCGALIGEWLDRVEAESN